MYENITINIMVESVSDTIKFYKETLGFDVELTVPEEGEILNFAIIKKDSISIMIESKEALVEEYQVLDTKEIKPMFTLFINVNDVEMLYSELKDKVTIAKDIHKTFYGKLEFAIFDNNKNILTFSN